MKVWMKVEMDVVADLLQTEIADTSQLVEAVAVVGDGTTAASEEQASIHQLLPVNRMLTKDLIWAKVAEHLLHPIWTRINRRLRYG